MGLTRRETETVVAQTLNHLEHDYDIEGVRDLGSPTIQEIAERIYVTENPTPNPRYTWSGWETGADVTPEEPGKEWLTIQEYGEEMAVIVLRVNAFEGDEVALTAARARKIEAANRIVNALNAQEAAAT